MSIPNYQINMMIFSISFDINIYSNYNTETLTMLILNPLYVKFVIFIIIIQTHGNFSYKDKYYLNPFNTQLLLPLFSISIYGQSSISNHLHKLLLLHPIRV